MTKIALLAATKYELPYKIREAYFSYRNMNFTVEISGIGQKKARESIRSLASKKPDYIFCLGFCGGVRNFEKIGDVLIPESVSYQKNRLYQEPATASKLCHDLRKKELRAYVGKLETSDNPVLSRRGLLEDTMGVDMESFGILEESKSYEIPVLLGRVISDIVPREKRLILPETRARAEIILNYPKSKEAINKLFESMIESIG